MEVTFSPMASLAPKRHFAAVGMVSIDGAS